jgi:hypothetical protein
MIGLAPKRADGFILSSAARPTRFRGWHDRPLSSSYSDGGWQPFFAYFANSGANSRRGADAACFVHHPISAVGVSHVSPVSAISASISAPNSRPSRRALRTRARGSFHYLMTLVDGNVSRRESALSSLKTIQNSDIFPAGAIMSRTIELPDAVYTALEKAAQASGTTPADWIAAQIPATVSANGASTSSQSDWLDRDFLRVYAHDADDSVSLDEVRKAMSKIPGRLADDIRAERDER